MPTQHPSSATDAVRHFVVLGASGGIGTAVARSLVREGHRVLLASRPSDRLASLADELSMPSCELDATDFEAVEACFAEAAERFGSVDGAVNCVGSVLLRPAHLTSMEDWQATVGANLTSAFGVVRAAAKQLRSNGGSVVLISSAAASIGLANHEAIAASKAGVSGLARSAAASYAKQGIRFNVVSPGLVQTELTRRIWDSPKSLEASVAMHALGRIGDPEDIARVIVWLLGEETSWITGQVLPVDGGLSSIKLH